MYEKLFRNQEEVFKVIANQKRLEIIQLLTHGELPVNEMVAMLGIPQANVSQHLSLLRQSHIVETRKEGTTVYYHLSNPKIAEACSLIRQFLIEGGNVTSELLRNNPDTLYPVVQDVVCGMRMAVSEAPEKIQHNGEEYFFCAGGCRAKFTKNPTHYAITPKAS